MSEVRQAHLDTPNLSKTDRTAPATISYSKPCLVHLQPPGVLTSDSFAILHVVRQTNSQAAPEHSLSNYRGPAQSPYCSCPTNRDSSTYSEELKISRWEDSSYLSCSRLLHPMQSHSSPLPPQLSFFLSSLPPQTP